MACYGNDAYVIYVNTQKNGAKGHALSSESLIFERKNIQMTMNRYLVILLFLFAPLASFAKIGRIPTYKSFIYWIQGVDTLYSEGNTILHESVSPDGTIVIRVRHEDWQQGVTTKSMERLAPWHATLARKRGLRAIINQGKANTDAMMPMKREVRLMENALSIDKLAQMTDRLEMNFACEYMIENTGTQEIVVNDLNRGLVWYLPAQSYLLLNMGTLPQACLLRIANNNPLQPAVKYVTIGSAGYEVKLTIAYEDDDCWIYMLNEQADTEKEMFDFTRVFGTSDNALRTHYIKRDKDSFQETRMTQDEVYAIIREAKERRDREKKN